MLPAAALTKCPRLFPAQNTGSLFRRACRKGWQPPRLESHDGVAVGREIVGYGGRRDDRFGRTAFDGNTLQELIFGDVDVVQPLAVIRTGRQSFIDAEGEAFQVCAVRIDAPKIGFGAAGSAERS